MLWGVPRLEELVQVATDVVVGKRRDVVAQDSWSQRNLRQKVHLNNAATFAFYF